MTDSEAEAPRPHFSNAADKNKDVILNALRGLLKAGDTVLEIASGTAQHALHFTEHWPEIIWQPSDRDLDEYGLAAAVAEVLAKGSRPNLKTPIVLDITTWPQGLPLFDAIYSANCIHVMPEKSLALYVSGAARHLKPGGQMLLYGPFKFDGAFTTPSNENFDCFLRTTYPGGGIRDFEIIADLAKAGGLAHEATIDMPSNNHILVFRKGEAL